MYTHMYTHIYICEKEEEGGKGSNSNKTEIEASKFRGNKSLLTLSCLPLRPFCAPGGPPPAGRSTGKRRAGERQCVLKSDEATRPGYPTTLVR